MHSQPEEKFLVSLFAALDAEPVSYAVMRNYDCLPYSSGGSDLDILVSKGHGEITKRTLINTIKLTGAVQLGVSNTPGFFKLSIIGENPDHTDRWWGLCVDVNVGLLYKGLTLLDDIQSVPVTRYRSINVLSDRIAGVLGVLKEVLNNSKVPERYFDCARVAAESEWDGTAKLLDKMGPYSVARFRNLMLEDTSDLSAGCNEVRRHFYRYAFSTAPLSFVKGLFSSFASRFKRYLKPSGIVIAVLGTDGAGKSTIINAIKPVLDQATHNSIVVRHLRPEFLPPLSRLMGQPAAGGGVATDPHSSEPSGFIGSFLRLAYLTANYFLGYWFDTRKHISKQPTVVIFDRYAYDLLLDQRRFRIDLPAWLVRFFTRFAPKPDLIFCLHGNPEILSVRKDELPLAEVDRQVNALRAFAVNEPRAILVSTEGRLESARDEVLHSIFAFCKARVDSK